MKRLMTLIAGSLPMVFAVGMCDANIRKKALPRCMWRSFAMKKIYFGIAN